MHIYTPPQKRCCSLKLFLENLNGVCHVCLFSERISICPTDTMNEIACKSEGHHHLPSDTSESPVPLESKPINDVTWARILTLLAFKMVTQKYLRRFWKHPGGVLFVSKFCIKATSSTTLAEANAMQFVARHTSIPVPKVYCAFRYKNRTYIVMQRINGHMLGYKWTLRSDESKKRILGQVKAMVEELRNIHPPEDIGVANVDGGPIYDSRLPRKSLWGPFKTIHDFHRELRDQVEVEAHCGNAGDVGNVPQDLRELISFHKQSWPRSVFTHGDLSSLNILAHGDEVVGIIDWETAGWFPPYWEYVSARNVNPRNQFWQKEVDKFLSPMPHELEMESIRRKYFGDF